jgi:small GTP-binding protein
MQCCENNIKIPEGNSVSLVKDDMYIPSDIELLVKIVLIGDSGVGKSTLVHRLINRQYDSQTVATIGVEYMTYNILVNGREIKLIIWDTSGQERFNAITSSYFRGMHVLLMAYDVTNSISFDNLTKWLKQGQERCEEFRIIVIGCKSDKLKGEMEPRQLPEELFNVEHIILSSKSNKNIGKLRTALEKIALAILKERQSLNKNIGSLDHAFEPF